MRHRYRLAPFALATVLLLFLPGQAGAKELTSVKVCGAAGCKTVTGRALLRNVIRVVEAQGKLVRTGTPAPAPFFRLEFFARGDQNAALAFTEYYTPRPARIAMQIDPGALAWVEPGPLRMVLDRLTSGVKPFGTATVTRVLVGGKAVRDPASYVRLFSLRTPTDDYPADGNWVTVDVETKGKSPWSTGAATLEYAPGTDALWRGSEFVSVPPGMASRLEARESLAAVAHGGLFPWLAVLGGVGGAALIVQTALLVRRRRA